MIPYFQWQHFFIGPLQIQVWGLCVALGMIVGVVCAASFARKRGIDPERVYDVSFWAILVGMIGARLWYVVTEWQYFSGMPFMEILSVWKGGFSFSGGVLSAAVVIVIYARRKRIGTFNLFGSMAYAMPLATAIGRLGCFFIYDHPGVPTTFVLGQRYIDGVVRHNHGLYLVLVSLVLALFFIWHHRTRPQAASAFYISVFCVWYGATRFALDFLRATDLSNADSRFWSLTAAQYVALGAIVIGALVWYAHTHETQQKNQVSTKKK